jgi:hypothetical protein
MRMNLIGLTLAGVLAAAVPARAQEDRINIPVADVPQPLRDLVKKFLPDGSITEATREVKKNEEQYRLRIFVSGRIVEAEFDVELNGGTPEGSLEMPVTPADVPKPVADAFQKALPELPLPKARKVVTIDENTPEGHVTYEWKLKDPKREVIITADGARAAVYQQIKESELPQAVRDSLSRDYSGVKIKKIERAVVNGVVSFALDISGGDDLVATADGKITVEDQ